MHEAIVISDSICGQSALATKPEASTIIKIRVFSVDEHPLMGQGIASVINAEPDMRVVAHAYSAREAIESFGEYLPDVTLMDLRLPDMSGIDAMIAIREEFPEARIVMFATSEGECEIRRALEAGAQSYIFKNMASKDLAETIREVHIGRKRIPPDVAARIAEHFGDEPLSEREVEVLKLVMGGKRNRQIASRLYISEETVKAHMKHLMAKLGAIDRTQAVTIALRRGVIHL